MTFIRPSRAEGSNVLNLVSVRSLVARKLTSIGMTMGVARLRHERRDEILPIVSAGRRGAVEYLGYRGQR